MAKTIDPSHLAELIKVFTPALGSEDFSKQFMTEFRHEDLDLPELHVNSKTVFANPLAIHISVSDLARSLVGTNEQVIRQLTDARSKLERTVANETKCSGCLHMDIKVEDNKNLMTGTTEFRLRTVCRRGTNAGVTSVICPDGHITARDGRPVAHRTMEPMVYLPPPEQDKPDLPTTNTGDTAW